MSPQPTTPAPFDDHFYQAALRELVEHGIELSRGLVKQAAAAPPPQPADKTHPSHRIVLSYDRITRSVRRTTALARELAFPKPARAEPGPPAAPNANPPRPRRAKPAPERLLRPEDFEDPDNPDWRQNWRNYLAKLTDAELDQLEAEMAADDDLTTEAEDTETNPPEPEPGPDRPKSNFAWPKPSLRLPRKPPNPD